MKRMTESPDFSGRLRGIPDRFKPGIAAGKWLALDGGDSIASGR
jgi:hypothetical protein